MTAPPTGLVGVDWGTSNLRAFRFGGDGEVLERRESGDGILRVENSDFEATLKSLVGDWLDAGPTTPILMCGMIGSRQGWREAPYVACPADLDGLTRQVVAVPADWADIRISPGLSHLTDGGVADVMRGEEAQVFGAVDAADDALLVAPGTHSKWAAVRQGRVIGFKTYLTGELYDVLVRASILGRLMDGEAPDDAAFTLGVERAVATPGLLGLLFSTRSEGLFEHLPATALAAYLSGLLIGSEVAEGLRSQAAAGPSPAPVILVASSRLRRLYSTAFGLAGHPVSRVIDGGDAAARGLWRLHEAMT
ncbi:MAG: 2-dehydro-3-deoxygalactonokinase [Caulobacter sp.]|nr:2-dehydro-3-deoxygalactonokinase [Caulobacter sp.]